MPRSRSRSAQRASSRSRSRSPASRSTKSKRQRSVSPYQMKSTSFFKFNSSSISFRKLTLANDDYDISIEGVIASSVKRVLEKMQAAYRRSEPDGVEDQSESKLFEWLVHSYEIKCKHESVAKQLNSSDNRIIVYCDPDDTLFSCGLEVTDEDVKNPAKWKGKNLLGLALMQVRCQIKEEWKAEHLDRNGKYIFKKKNFY